MRRLAATALGSHLSALGSRLSTLGSRPPRAESREPFGRRVLLVMLALLAAAPASAPGQPAAPRSAADSAAVAAQLRREVGVLDALRLAGDLPPADRFVVGGRTIPAGSRVTGPVAVAYGPLVVLGMVQGDAIALHGDVVVREGGRVTGDARAMGGRVRVLGGTVDGSMRAMGLPDFGAPRAPVALSPAEATMRAVKLVLGWFAILTAIGIGVLIFAEGPFHGVSETLERHFGRSFWFGLAAQIALLPLLLVIVVALALTIIGALLVPFAIVAYVIAVAGLVTLGFLAVARFTGRGMRRLREGSRSTPRAIALAALLRGLAVYLAVWLLAAAFTWQPLAGTLLRAVAVAVTWVVLTLGLGAAIALRVERGRGGRRRPKDAMDPMVWATPTPVTGVAAARRAKPMVRSAE
jgi:hypothetical protein